MSPVVAHQKSCEICKRTGGYLFGVEIPVEGQEDEHMQKYICGQCWDAVAAVAQQALASTLKEIRGEIAALKAAQEGG